MSSVNSHLHPRLHLYVSHIISFLHTYVLIFVGVSTCAIIVILLNLRVPQYIIFSFLSSFPLSPVREVSKESKPTRGAMPKIYSLYNSEVLRTSQRGYANSYLIYIQIV